MTGFGETGKGCDVIEDESLHAECKDLFKGKHSWRGYKDSKFGDAFQACEESANDPEELTNCQRTVKDGMKRIESGRFHPMLRETVRFWFALDRDEKEEFAKRNPDLIKSTEQYTKTQRGTRGIKDEYLEVAEENFNG